MTLAATPRESNDNIKSGRDANGRGNPFARRVAAMRAALFEEIDEATFRQLVRGLAQMARDKNLAAMRLILLYLVGKPADLTTPDDLDHLEDELLDLATAPQAEADREVDDLVPTEVANDSVQTAVPPGPPVEPTPPEPIPTVTTREQRPVHAANEGQSMPTWYTSKRRQKNRGKKGKRRR